jgi:hypothetical protein
MQKLRFINGNGDEFDFTSGNFGVTKWAGLSNTNLNIQTQQVPYNDGSVFIDGLLQDRTLSITVAVNDNNNLALRYELRRRLISALNPKLGEGYLYYKNDYIERRIKVIPQLPIFDNKNSNDSGTLKASVSFTSCSVYWEDVEETVVNMTSEKNTIIINEGDVPADVTIKLSPSNNEKINLINKTNDTKLTINGNFHKPINVSLNFGNKKSQEINLQTNYSMLNLDYVVNCNGILYGSKGKDLFKSDDGKKFKFVRSFNVNISDMCYIESKNMLIVVSLNILNITTDFENWETTTVGNGVSKIKYNSDEDKFFIASDKIYYSDDLVTFNYLTASPNLSYQLPEVNNRTINDNNYVFYFYSSSNLYGVRDDYETIDNLYSGSVTDFYYWAEKDIYIIVTNSSVLYSFDGVNFETATYQQMYGRGKIFNYRGYLYKALYSGGNYISRSQDGVNWESFPLKTSIQFNSGVVFDGNFFLYSTRYWFNYIDNIFQESNIPNYSLITESDSELFVINGTSLYSSTDCINFELKSTIPSGVNFIKYLNNILFIGLDNGILYYSTNKGESFESVLISSSYAYDVNDIDYKEGFYFIAVGNILFTSEDLIEFNFGYRHDTSTVIKQIICVENNFVYLCINKTSTSDLIELSFNNNTFNVIKTEGFENTFIIGSYNPNIDVLITAFNDSSIYFKRNASTTNYLESVKSNYSSNNSIFAMKYYSKYNCYFAINYEGIYYSSDGDEWFKIFEINLLNYVGFISELLNGIVVSNLYSSLIFNFFLDTNIISSITDISLILDVGKNELILNPKLNDCNATLIYRQKYIGV